MNGGSKMKEEVKEVKMKKFSLIVPCYKHEATLSRLIKSVLDQNYPEKEIIVVFDGPSKEGEKIVSLFPGVQSFSTGDKNLGAPVARNLGATKATGDYYCFLDSDMWLYPGALRAWSEAFDTHPDCVFVYGGYKFDQGETFASEEFDPYFLKIANYIDGNFPMRKEIFPGWDVTLKSLQDWDMWLTIIEAGHKGFYMKDQYFFEKLIPQTGSISWDSHNNWDDRVATVKKKHKLLNRPVCLTSFAATHHAKRCAKLLDFDYLHPALIFSKMPAYKAIYSIGNFPANAENNLMPYMNSKTNPITPRTDVKGIIHWIGTDVLHLRKLGMSFDALKKYVDMLNKKFIQFCQSKENQKELEEVGVKVTYIPLPIEVIKKDIPYPKNFTVAIYDHMQNDIYCQPLMVDLIQSMPDIDFVYFGDSQMRGSTNIKNLKFLGHIPIDQVLAKSTILLRITKHDGFPVSPVEFLCAGRAVICNQKCVKYAKLINTGMDNTAELAKIKRDIMKAIREYKKKMPNKKFFDNAIRYYKRIFNPSTLKEAILKAI
jgi:glycosyltransferase involved in cell wall biosynthesis